MNRISRCERMVGFALHQLYHLLNCDNNDLYTYSLEQARKCLADRSLSINNKRIRRLYLYKKRHVIPRIVVSVTNRCTLKCKDCNMLIPLCKETYYETVENLIDDLTTLLKICDLIVNVELIGGEAFIHKDLDRIVDWLIRQPKIMFVDITTNGTVQIKDGLFGVLKSPKLLVNMSNYGLVNSARCTQVMESLKQHNIIYKNLDNQYWKQAGGIEKRNRTSLCNKFLFYNCRARIECRTLYNGKLFICGRAPILNELGQVYDNDYLNVRGEDLSWVQLKEFYRINQADSCDCCDYATDDVEIIKSGRQMI